MRRYIKLLCAGALALQLVGCGSSSGSSGGAVGGSSRMATFLTDSFREDFSNVWGVLFKVELVNSVGVATTLFTDATGKTVDFKTLRDGSGARFLFLGNNTIPAGTYSKMRVTVAPNMSIFRPGAAGGTAVTLTPSLPRDGQGNVMLETNFAPPRFIGNGTANLVVDFDLANFVLNGTQLTPAIREGEQTGLQETARHEHEDYKGVVGNLGGTAPNLQFVMTPFQGNPVTVVMDSSTNLYNENGASSPTLTNGKRVEVRGVFETTTGNLIASDVMIKTGESENHRSRLLGAPSEINAVAGTFSVQAREVEEFVPAQSKVSVTTSTNTVFRGDSGVKMTAATFFVALATTAQVKVEGTYNKETNTLVATSAKIRLKGDDGHHGGHGGGDNGGGRDGEAKGTPVSIDASAKTFALNPVSDFEGFVFAGGALTIQTNAQTDYRLKNGTVVGAGDFFVALTGNVKVEVKGSFSAGVLTASRLKIDD